MTRILTRIPTRSSGTWVGAEADAIAAPWPGFGPGSASSGCMPGTGLRRRDGVTRGAEAVAWVRAS